ncbi:maleylpyruvate isomerase N-terminal domain-containing protein [Actinomadura barringtoniae]|uniref:Maleylpyruvate isomerase N-terminal domain-containing protein n=1 Tax=Actinomadura barringtoniae TaxID=1427535 RepID=A0A939P6F9_9ACTN|nr:maleylpyruvate isomerase N-terminal domain-containing protein [Actinomadura barringtoniae]MBO2446218.1 maleylpyruvate isomerase N-terminal domain-containing protein [Actinomadura barringtoniae]
MNDKKSYFMVADSAVELLADPAVAAAWHEPSALEGFTVGGLAEHLASQIFNVRRVLDAPLPPEPPIGLLDHYERVAWTTSGLDHEANVIIRKTGEDAAAEGPAAMVNRARAALGDLRETMPEDRPVFLPWVRWSLSLNDLLITRLMELAVHSDDLAVSVGLPTPVLPDEATDVVAVLLTRLAVRKHGLTPVLRALSRAERAPETIAAF